MDTEYVSHDCFEKNYDPINNKVDGLLMYILFMYI